MNGMKAKQVEKEKLELGRMCYDLKAKRQVRQTEQRRRDGSLVYSVFLFLVI